MTRWRMVPGTPRPPAMLRLVSALLVLGVLGAGGGVRATPEPTAPPDRTPGPAGAVLVPETAAVTVGYTDESLVGRIALVIADAAGYFRDAGFTDVTIMQVEEPLPGLLNGDLDFAVLDARQAADANALGLPVEAIAGYRSASSGSVSGDASPAPEAVATSSPAATTPSTSVALDLIAATTDTVTARPGTVTAFTIGYVRALGDLRARFLGEVSVAHPSLSPSVEPSEGTGATPSASPSPYGDPILDAAAGAGLTVPPDVLAAWPAPLAGFAPFDGGFDEPVADDGLASLRNLFASDPGSMPDLTRFVSEATLHAAQQALGLPPNPLVDPRLDEATR